MKNQIIRPLDSREKEIINKLLEKEFGEREIVRKQLSETNVIESSDGTGTLIFDVGKSGKPPHWIPVEAECKDIDGVPIHVLLHMRENMIYELEIYKEDSTPIIRKPTADQLELI